MIDVLIVTTKLSYGGVQTFLINNVEPLLKRGIRLNFAVQTKEKQKFDEYVINKGCMIYQITSLNESKIKFMKDIRDILTKNPQIKIIHSHQNFANIYSLIASHKLGVRISHSHNTYKPKSFLNKILKEMWKLWLPIIATDYWGCSEKANRWLYGHHSMSNKSEVIKNAVNTQRFLFNEEIRIKLRKQLNICNKFTLIHVGTFSHAKNHIWLLKLFAKQLQRNNNSHLILCGDGVLRKDIEHTIQELGIESNVSLLGNISNPEEYLFAADVMVFPSLFEGFPFSIIEAQASGIPIVCSYAIPEDCLITSNIFRIAPIDYNEYLNKINEFTYSKEERILNNKTVRDAGYDIEQEADRISKLYKIALTRK